MLDARAVLAAAFLAVGGCVGAAAGDDAGSVLDAAVADAPRASADAPGSGLDASWGACAVSGVAGVCLETSACDGERMSVPGLCPGPASIQCCVPRLDAGPAPDASGPDARGPDAGVCDPTAMPLPNEGLLEAPGEGGCPSGMVPVTTTLCIDRYEASLLEVLGDGSLAEWSPNINPGAPRVRAVSRAGAVPQAYIDGVRAGQACEEAGKRLCTDTEWLRACQGSTDATYPYGDTRMTGVCNDHRDVHPAIERFGTSDAWIWSRLDDACIDQLPRSLARTGTFDGCQSECGALDLMGNLHEWTADPAGTFRGGFYVDTVLNGPGCLYRTTAHDTGHWDYSTGFRCCADRP